MIDYFMYAHPITPAAFGEEKDVRYITEYKIKPREVTGVDFHSVEARYCDVTFVANEIDRENIFEKAGVLANTDFYECVFGIQVNGELQYFYVKDRNYVKKYNEITLKGENLIGLLLKVADKKKIWEVDDPPSDPTEFLKELIDNVFSDLQDNYHFNSGVLVNDVINNFADDEYYDIEAMETTNYLLQDDAYHDFLSGECIYQEPDWEEETPFLLKFKWIGEIDGYDDPVLILVSASSVYQSENIFLNTQLAICFEIKNGQYLYLPEGNLEYAQNSGSSNWAVVTTYSPPKSNDVFYINDPANCCTHYEGISPYTYDFDVDDLILTVSGGWHIKYVTLKKNYDPENTGTATVARYNQKDLIKGLLVINNLTLVCDDEKQITIESKKAKSDMPCLPIDEEDVKEETTSTQIISEKDFDSACSVFRWGEGLAFGVEFLYDSYIINKITDTRKLVVKNTFDTEQTNSLLNGDFSDGENNWNLEDNWSVANERAEKENSLSDSVITQDDVFEVGKIYKIEIEAGGFFQGGSWFGRIQVWAGTNKTDFIYYGGTYSFFLQANGRTLTILGSATFGQANPGWVDNVKVYGTDIDILSNVEYDGKEFWIAGINRSIDNELLELEIWEKVD